MRRLSLLAFVLVLLASGCGGPPNYSLAKTRACLAKKTTIVPRLDDFVASTATGGAFRARFPDKNFVTVVFGESVKDGEQIELAYRRFAFPNVRKGLADVLRRDRNAVMLWHEHPADADLATVQGCLK